MAQFVNLFRIIVCTGFLTFIVCLPSKAQNDLEPIRPPAPVLDAQIWFIWQCDGNAKVEIGGKEYFLQWAEPKKIDLKAGTPYEFAVIKPGKKYYNNDFLTFKKGVDSIFINLATENSKTDFIVIVETAAMRKAERERLLKIAMEKELELKAKMDIAIAEIEANMVKIFGGSFLMGCTEGQNGCGWNENPVREVTVGDFFISKYELTQKIWNTVMDYKHCFFGDCDDCPIVEVSWNEVQDFIFRLNLITGKHFRLPTEAEWEYAARGGNQSKGYRYSGGNVYDEVAWHEKSGICKQVGQKQSNELGLFDMSGNVWEWCADYYDQDYYKIGQADNPIGPSTGLLRSIRGGSWDGLLPSDCTVTNRTGGQPGESDIYGGFRLVLDF